jgi:signal transduction histidine kinase
MDLSSRSHRLYRRAVWLTALMPAPMLLLVALPAYRQWAFVVWAACYLLFLSLLWRASRRPEHTVPLALTQAGLALGAVMVLPTTAEGAMLVAASAQLASRWPAGRVISLAVATSMAFGFALGRQASLELAVDVPLAWFGFQVFAVLLTTVARSEADGRLSLKERNIQLLATRQLLAQRTRAAERLRLSRDLHDGLGHHLTALSLNLEAAAHLCRDDAREHLVRAQDVARSMLADVRTTVSDLRPDPADPMPAIRALANAIDEPRVHIEGPDSLEGQWMRTAPAASECLDAVLRLAQEVMTNAVRHASAQNLWISITASESLLTFVGRDDGHGADQVREGHCLTGMRERLALVGGTLEIASASGRGFVVRAAIPMGAAST